MQKAPVMKGSGLEPLDDDKSGEQVHVFGRNLEERVVTKSDQDDSSASISFHTPKLDQAQQEDDIESIRKRKFDAITGEEDEETIFQGDFKLFVWDLATSNWIEKGRGQLKLNDSLDGTKSRLIMRISGTLRILLNVSVNKSFFKVIANSKTNIRFTDSQTVWAASGSNAQQLKDLIDARLKTTLASPCQSQTDNREDDTKDLEPRKKARAGSESRSETGSSESEHPSSQNSESETREPEDTNNQEDSKTTEPESKNEVETPSPNESTQSSRSSKEEEDDDR